MAPGQNVTFSFNAIAPGTPGTYNFQWKMLQQGVEWFGPLTPNVAVLVGTPNAAFVSQSVPAQMVQGLSYPVSVTMQNTGNLTWSPGQHYLRSQNPQDNTAWGTNRVELPSAVPPGQNVTFNFNAVPSAAGTVDFQWRMADGAASFGASSTNVAVAVDVPENAQFVSQVVPATMAPGQTYVVRVTMHNAGSTTWTSAAGYKLGSQNPQDNTTWGYRIPLPHDVGPGQNVAFTFSVTAPSTVGTHDFQWKMLREGFDWFGTPSANVAINVQAGHDTGVHYIHVDHLNTPRLVANAAGTTVWLWHQAEPFGTNVPDENPSGLGVFDLPLRLPGQYFDKETNLHYNYYRDYDPGIGRYPQSDPIGLQGGLNTYLYANGNPLSLFDPDGLKAMMCCRLLDSFVLGSVGRQRHCYFDVDGTTYGLYPEGNVGVPRINDPRDRGGICKECKPPKCSDVKSCIKDQHDFYGSGSYSVTGPKDRKSVV